MTSSAEASTTTTTYVYYSKQTKALYTLNCHKDGQSGGAAFEVDCTKIVYSMVIAHR